MAVGGTGYNHSEDIGAAGDTGYNHSEDTEAVGDTGYNYSEDTEAVGDTGYNYSEDIGAEHNRSADTGHYNHTGQTAVAGHRIHRFRSYRSIPQRHQRRFYIQDKFSLYIPP